MSIYDKCTTIEHKKNTKRDIIFIARKKGLYMIHADEPDLSTPGSRLRFARKEAGLSPEALAALCGWGSGVSKGKSRITSYENNSREPSIKDMEKMSRHLKYSAAWITYGGPLELLSSLYWIPVFSLYAVIKWHSCMENARETKEKIPMCEKGYEECYAVKITNNLMKPEVNAGEFVIVNPKQKPKDGKLVIAYKQGSEEAMLKRYTVDGPNISLRSNQEDVEKINIDETIKILGVVVLIQASRVAP